MAVDYQKIAASVYKTVLNMNSVATSLIGLDAIYCRLLPYDNGEDVIVQEYTLHQYDCPQTIKVVASNTDYLAGTYTIDLWGMHLEVPLEISIDINTWKSIFGVGTMPLKGDFIIIQLIHKAFEVKSSLVVYTVGEQATSYKCQLGVWQHNANRKETEDFKISIDELTDSQDRLFGDAISKEVADAVVEVETAYNTTTYVDPLKDFDMDSIILTDGLIGKNGNKFAEAYYHFINATKNVTYNIEATYNPEVKENHWIYSCWFKVAEENTIQSGQLKIKDIYIKEKDYWWLTIESGIQIEEGDRVTIYRGGVIKLTGTIDSRVCEGGFTIKLSASDCLKAQAKVANWYKTGTWKILKYVSYNLLTGYNDDNITFKLDIDGNNINVVLGNIVKTILFTSAKALSFDTWHYIAFDICQTAILVVVIRSKQDRVSGHYIDRKVILNNIVPINIKEFSFNTAAINNMNIDIDMCNIRLYENEYELGDTYLEDMYSEVTRNASKLILVDAPNAANNMSFKSKVR